MKCPNCDSRDIDFQEAGGQSICMSCGTVVEENTIVSSIEFQETGDRSHVIGQFVAANCAKPFMSSSRIMGRHVDNKDSKEVSLLNARRIISHIVSQMRLPSLYTDRAHRLYQMAIMREVNAGRKQSYLVAACLYVVCRQDKSPHLLIDFSDALQVNVYSLDVIDPSLYLHRYAEKLDFGDTQARHDVILTALRVITRLKKDWIVIGRRPDGVCAAALLIASRAHEFDITQEQIANLFHISFETVRKRIMEFRNTPAAQLTLQEFYALHDELQLEFDPPAFIRNQMEENETVELCLGEYAIPSESCEVENETAEGGFQVEDLAKDQVYADTNPQDSDSDSDPEKSISFPSPHTAKARQSSNLSKLIKSHSQVSAPALTAGHRMVVGDVTINVPFPNFGRPPAPMHTRKGNGMMTCKSRDQQRLYSEIYQEFHISPDQENEIDEEDDYCNVKVEGVQSSNPYYQSKKNKNKLQERHLLIKLDLILHSTTTSYTTSAPTVHPSKVVAEVGEDGLISDEFLDDDEVINCLFNDDEKQKRTALFNTTYGPFLEERERRRLAREGEANADSDRYTQTGKLRKKYQRKLLKQQQDATSGEANVEGSGGKVTAASQALSTARATIKATSKKINYEALQGVFDDNGSFAMPTPRSASSRPKQSASSSSSARQQERELAALSGATAASLFMQSTYDDGTTAAGGVGQKRKRTGQRIALGGGQHANQPVKKEESEPPIISAKQAIEAITGSTDMMMMMDGGYEEDDFDYDHHHYGGGGHDLGDDDYDD